MQLLDLQDKLRAHIRARIERGELTGTGLSRQAGFQQGHLSNFLHARRGLSVESMDRLLASLEIGVLDLVDADEIQARMPQSQDALESVVVVSIEQATRSARFSAEQVREAVSFRRSFLRRLKPNDTVNRSDWLRFVLIKLEAAAAAGVSPALPTARACCWIAITIPCGPTIAHSPIFMWWAPRNIAWWAKSRSRVKT